MKQVEAIHKKIVQVEELKQAAQIWKMQNKKIVFTNGVFDMLHAGHLQSLSDAAAFGDVLIVAVNSDKSVQKLKGPQRPIIAEGDRALLLAHLLVTDAVIIFDDETPLQLIKKILPDVLAKGGDYTIENIAGAREVLAAGGEVKLLPLVQGISTTNLIAKLQR